MTKNMHLHKELVDRKRRLVEELTAIDLLLETTSGERSALPKAAANGNGTRKKRYKRHFGVFFTPARVAAIWEKGEKITAEQFVSRAVKLGAPRRLTRHYLSNGLRDKFVASGTNDRGETVYWPTGRVSKKSDRIGQAVEK